jgi:uncharacterized membrane protein YfcA
MMVRRDAWSLFAEGWPVALTMAAGSFIAGATSEGGGAVAFPVLTLGLGVAPPVARDFSLLIQSVGMSAAAVTIFALRIPVEIRAIAWAGIGGALGVVFGMEVVAPLLTPAPTKLFFVSVWASFGVALHWINRHRDREVRGHIGGFNPLHGGVLLLVGVLGGSVSGITGSGLDILTFSVLVLAFRLDERVATPTSVVLMATNSVVAVAWRQGFAEPMDPQAWAFWWVSVPIVVVGAPLGARFIRERSRRFVVGFLLLSIAVQFVAAVLILPMDRELWLFTGGVLAAGLAFFRVVTWLGDHAPQAAWSYPREGEGR